MVSQELSRLEEEQLESRAEFLENVKVIDAMMIKLAESNVKLMVRALNTLIFLVGCCGSSTLKQTDLRNHVLKSRAKYCFFTVFVEAMHV